LADLLLISDLHLGSHLKPRMRGESVHLASRIEEIFPRFLDHYMHEGRRWQLVINGDFIDFWNVELADQKYDDGERLAVRRLHAVLDAHPAVEDALARFLEAGHGIVFVTGNHDAELLYSGVRAAMVQRIEGAMARVEADASIKHEARQVLFSVTPNDGAEALDRIREALDVYLRLPDSLDFSAQAPSYGDIAVQQLQANIYHLKGQLMLASAVLQARDAQIEALQLSNFTYQQLLATQQQAATLPLLPPGKPDADAEPLVVCRR
jgi:hypothetical protein